MTIDDAIDEIEAVALRGRQHFMPDERATIYDILEQLKYGCAPEWNPV